jgi:hypothetical protein
MIHLVYDGTRWHSPHPLYGAYWAGAFVVSSTIEGFREACVDLVLRPT